MAEASVKKQITSSQEDYLEAIWALTWQEGVARVSDIADWLGVSMSSVTGALKGLAERKLVEYTPHRQVTLSDRGMEVAEKISSRHQMLRHFLTDVFDVGEELADRNACRIEHAVDEIVSKKMSLFVEFLSKTARGEQWIEEFSSFCAQGEAERATHSTTKDISGVFDDGETARKTITLADLAPGRKAKVIRVSTTAATNRRLAVMGMTRNEIISVVRIAPLGDPIEVKVRGYSLSLRKAQARGIEVEELV